MKTEGERGPDVRDGGGDVASTAPKEIQTPGSFCRPRGPSRSQDWVWF